jgi:hypothetical protein
MEENFITNLMKDIDDILDSPIQMVEANQPIIIFEGEFIIKDETRELKIIGKIQYNWVPDTGVIFYGKVIEKSITEIKDISSIEYVDVIANGTNIGKGIISNFNISNEIEIKGVFQFQVITGDKTIAVDKLKFCIPNFRNFLGLPVKKITKTNHGSYRNRIILDNEKYTIIIDKCLNSKNLYDSVTNNGGFIILYSGELKVKKGALTFENSKEVIQCLNQFLCFLNGKRISALFIHGMYQDETIWCDYSNYYVDSYDTLPSWTNSRSIENLNELWKVFSNKWNNKNDSDVLNTAIHWYLEANKNSGFVEGSIIMAQTALELLYNWYIVENKKLLLGKDSENINAANKIRLLISQLSIDYTVPKKFTALQSFLKSGKLIDAPEAVVQIRNAIVHSQEEKRTKLNKIDDNAKYEALQLCIWYIEMSLLKILDFKGIYSNRVSENNSSNGKCENVPWMK